MKLQPATLSQQIQSDTDFLFGDEKLYAGDGEEKKQETVLAAPLRTPQGQNYKLLDPPHHMFFFQLRQPRACQRSHPPGLGFGLKTVQFML